MQPYIVNEQGTQVNRSSLLELLVRRDDIVCIMTFRGTQKVQFTLHDDDNQIWMWHTEFKRQGELDQFLKFHFEDWYAVEWDINDGIRNVDLF